MAKNRTLLPGVAISLLLHAGLLAMLVQPAGPPRDAAPEARRMMVWLTPPPMRASPASPLPAARPPTAAPQQDRRQPARPAPHPGLAGPAGETGAPTHAGTPATPAALPPPSAPTVTMLPAPSGAGPDLPADPFAAAPAPAPVKGRFDVDAAMKSARKLATAKSTRDDPPVAQIYDKPLYGLPNDTPLGTAVARTARPDCKNVAAGTGLLALIIVPAMILTDKKDSGCKW